ncbi:MAG: hypothetical protein ABRQ37_13385, partial [Candidatus Eremiobacterota bacterium]
AKGQDELRAEIAKGQDELRAEIAKGQDELRAEFTKGQDELRKGQDELRKGQDELRNDFNNFREETNKRLDRVEFEFIDTRITIKKEIIPVINIIAENQKIMFNHVTNLTTTMEDLKQEITATGHRVREHEEKLETLL